MWFSMKHTIIALLFTASAFVAADDTPASNDTAPAGNDTTSAGNTTLAGNGTTTNATNSTNGTEGDAPEPSGGTRKRTFRECEYACPPKDLRSQSLALSTNDANTFTCTYGADSCTYRTASGVLSFDQDDHNCPAAAVPLVAGCIAGESNNGGVEKRRRDAHKRHARRSSWELQYAAIARSAGL